MSTAELQLSVGYRDDDMLDLVFRVRSEAISAEVGMVVEASTIQDLITTASQFPTHIGDMKEIEFSELGGLSPRSVRIGLSTLDLSGHCLIRVQIERDKDSTDIIEKANVAFVFDPSSIDQFVEQLEQVNSDRSNSATLRGI